MTTSINGVWSAVLLNGKTVYQSGATVLDGPVTLAGTKPVLYILSGAVVEDLSSPMSGFASEWGSAIIQSGGTLQDSALQTVVTVVSSGGVLANNTLNHTGDKIYAGGTALDNVKFNGGDLTAAQGAKVYNLSIAQGSSILSGAVWTGGTVQSGGIVSATSGTLVQNALVLSGGQIQVISGSTAQGAIISGTGIGNTGNPIQGSLILSVGGTSIDASIQGGYMAVQGAEALSLNAYVTSNGWQDVGSNNNGTTGGGVASATTLVNGGAQFVKSGVAVDTSISSGGQQTVSVGGTAVRGTVFSAGSLQIAGGGTGINNVVLSGGKGNVWGLELASNGQASGLVIQNGGSAVSLSGGRLTDLSFLGGGKAVVSSAGSIDNSIVSSGAQVHLQSGGTASQLTAFGGGWWSYTAGAVLVGSGATAFNTVLSGAYQGVQGLGAYAQDTLVTNNGWQDVGINSYDKLYGGEGIASGSTLISGGKQFISGGTARQTQVSAGGTQTVMQNGIASNTHIVSGGSMAVLAGGTTFNPGADAGAVARVSQGGTAIASDGIASGATILNGGSALGQSGGRIVSFSIQGGAQATISSGGFIDQSVISAGGSAHIQSGGIASHLTVFGNGWPGTGSGAVLVGSGGTALNTVLSGAYQGVQGPGAYAQDTLVTNNGWQDVGLNSYDGLYGGGGIASGSILMSGGKQFVSGGTAHSTIVSAGGTQSILQNGLGFESVVLSGGRSLIAQGGVISGGTINQGGLLSAATGGSYGGHISAAGMVSGGTIQTAGILEILSGGAVTSPMILSGGSMQIDSGGRLSGLASLAAQATATVGSDAGGTVNLGGQGFSLLTVTGNGNPTTVISGFNGTNPTSSDQITLRDIPKSDIIGVEYPDANSIKFLLVGDRSIVLNIPGVKKFGFDLANGPDNSTVFSVCFLSGTMIRTPEGERAIETLVSGDWVYVYHNDRVEQQRIVWIGNRSVTEPESASYGNADYPVRIKEGSFGSGLPYRDLLVTPEHCLYIDNVLIPARMLVNGLSIQHDTELKEYTYYHIETETHAVVIADGLMCETYLDTGNRASLDFCNTHVPDSQDAMAEFVPGISQQDYVAPLGVSRSIVEPVWRRLARHAGLTTRCDQDVSCDPKLYLCTEEGENFFPSRTSGDRYIFHIPARVGLVYLCSRSARPSEAIGPYVDDRRILGVLIGSLTLFDACSCREIDVQSFLHYARGWHGIEQGKHRWTMGRAVLPLGSSPETGSRILAVQILAAGPYVAGHVHRLMSANDQPDILMGYEG